jgi:hypothetical protein
MPSGTPNALPATSWRTAIHTPCGTRLRLRWIPSTRTPPTTAPGWSWTATEGWESATWITPIPTDNLGRVMTANDGRTQKKHTETAKLCLG